MEVRGRRWREYAPFGGDGGSEMEGGENRGEGIEVEAFRLKKE